MCGYRETLVTDITIICTGRASFYFIIEIYNRTFSFYAISINNITNKSKKRRVPSQERININLFELFQAFMTYRYRSRRRRELKC